VGDQVDRSNHGSFEQIGVFELSFRESFSNINVALHFCLYLSLYHVYGQTIIFDSFVDENLHSTPVLIALFPTVFCTFVSI